MQYIIILNVMRGGGACKISRPQENGLNLVFVWLYKYVLRLVRNYRVQAWFCSAFRYAVRTCIFIINGNFTIPIY